MSARIDSHHHVWDLSVRDQPWIIGDEMAAIRRTFEINDLIPDLAAVGIDATVLVQTVASVTETEELLDLAARTPSIAGVVGFVDISAPNVAEQLDRLIDRPSGHWLVGIRNLVQDQPDPAWLARPEAIAGLTEIARRGLVYDLLIRPHQFDAARDAVDAVSDGRFVLDHIGKPSILDHAWQPWADSISGLARRDNVSVKVSGLVTEADWTSWHRSDLQPYVDHVLAAFGPARSMFGSDWPACLLAASYADVHRLANELADGLSTDEVDAVFGRTAATVYNLSLDPAHPKTEIT